MKRYLKASIIVFASAFLLVSLIAAGYFYYRYQDVLKQKNLSEIEGLLNSLSQVMELPDEIPTLATVTDKTKLEEQPFFQKAENGDKVLIYQKAQKAILYRPSIGKVIDVVSVKTIDQVATAAGRTATATPFLSPTPIPTPSPTLEVISAVLYNGTEKEGITFNLGDRLMEEFANLRIIDRDYAARRDYKKTLVINLSGNSQAQVVAQFLNAKVDVLPKGEVKPEADLLIIVGSDQG